MRTGRTALVTDSSCDATDEELARLGIECVHLGVSSSDGTPLDVGNDPASIERFYDCLDAARELPKTSMPSPVEFGELYSRLALEGYTRVLSVHIGEKFSGCCQAARMAAVTADVAVEVVDSGLACWPLALVMRRLAQLRDAGAGFDALADAARRLSRQANVCFTVDSMRNLVMGGRAGRAVGLAATLLDIKPLLTIGDDGVVYSPAKAKSMKRALAKMAGIAEREVRRLGPLEGFFVHTRNPEGAKALQALFEERGIAFRALGTRLCGPAITTHVGTGCVGFSYLPEASA